MTQVDVPVVRADGRCIPDECSSGNPDWRFTFVPLWVLLHHASKQFRSRHSNGNDPNGRARIPVGLMPGVAAHKVNSAAGGREGPLGEAVRAKA